MTNKSNSNQPENECIPCSAFYSIAEEMTHVAKELNESFADCPCDTCDCETDNECKVDTETVEDKNRNSIRED